MQSRFKRRSSPEGRSSRRAQLAGRPAGPPTEQGAQDPGRQATEQQPQTRTEPAGRRAPVRCVLRPPKGPSPRSRSGCPGKGLPLHSHKTTNTREAAGPPTEAVLPVPDSSGPRRPEKLSGGTEPPPRTRPPCPRRPPLEHRPRAREPPAGGAAGSCHLRRPAEPGLWQRARPTQTLPTISSAK